MPRMIRFRTGIAAAGGAATLLALVVLPVLPLGCAPQANNYRLGVDAMQRGRVDEALIWLERAVVYDPGNAPAHRDYGTALYLSGNPAGALRELEQARALGLRDGPTAFYRGLAYEGVGRPREAIDAYAEFVDVGEVEELRMPVKIRLRKLSRALVEEEMQIALAADRAGGGEEVAPPDVAVVAVLPFRSLVVDAELEPLRTGLAALVAADLERIEDLEVVDRERIAAVRRHLGLEHGAMVDSLGVERSGRLIGAGRLVTGGLRNVASDRLEIDGAVAEVASGALRWTDPVDDDTDRFYTAQKRLTFAILEAMGIEPSSEIRQLIESSVPTESLLALLAYARGLELEDRGLGGEARTAFLDALALDPQFQLVLDGLERLGVDEAVDDDQVLTPEELAEQDIEIRSHRGQLGQEAGAPAANAAGDETAEEPAGPPTDVLSHSDAFDDPLGVDPTSAASRLYRSSQAAQVGQTPFGSNDTREPSVDALAPGGVGEAVVDIDIEIPE